MTGLVVEAGTGKPLPGIAVSDGHSVTVTGEDGSFTLELHPDAEFVFVTVPGTHLALGDFFVDVRDSHTAPDHHVFTLTPRPGGAPRRFRFVQVTDLHVAVDGGESLRRYHEAGVATPDGGPITAAVSEDELRADATAVVAREQPDFLVATGDLANHGRPEELAAYLRAITAPGIPVAHVPGNHDFLSCLNDETVARFAEWWEREGRHSADDPYQAFHRRVLGGDWRDPHSGRQPWLEVIGPPYYSFDWGGVHFVVDDSEGRARYGEDYPVDRWLAADLALAAGRPVIALQHFPEPGVFFERRYRGVDLLASFAGHWHGDRAVLDGPTAHFATPTLGFSGYDHSPPGYRVVDVDGTDLHVRFHPLEPPWPPRAYHDGRWEATLPGRPGVGPPVVAGDRVVVAGEVDDGAGWVAGFHPADGHRVWARRLPGGVKHGVAVSDSLVVACTVTGRVIALAAADGEVRWERQLGDPASRWCFARPAVGNGRVFAGAAGYFAALDADTGDPLWLRDDLAASDWPVTLGSPTVAGDLVIVPFAASGIQLCALEVATGEERWRHEGSELAAPWSTPAVAGDLVVVATVSGWLRACRRADGEERWRAALDGPWSLPAPVTDGSRVFAVGSGGAAMAFDAATGECLWSSPDAHPPIRPRLPYRRRPGGQVASPVVSNGCVYVATNGGSVRVLDGRTGELRRRHALSLPLGSTPAVARGTLYLPTDAGTLIALPA